MVEVPKNIIQMMIDQHKVLKGEFGVVSDILERDSVGEKEAEEIVQTFKKFEIDLNAHLKLENEVFYVGLIKKMKERGMKTQKTEEFIGEMSIIGKKIYDFLDRFSSSQNILSDLETFKQGFAEIKDTLILRVESEEDGVFMYWGLVTDNK